MSNENSKNEAQPVGPKIIVDSDWKEQVAKEKQVAAEQTANASKPHDETSSPSDPATSETGTGETGTGETVPNDAATSQSRASDHDENESAASEVASAEQAKTESVASARSQHLPTPTFEILVSMLFTQAISALGQMPNPIDGKTSVDKPMAKHSIDMLDMLTIKTKGNLSEDESKMLSEALHALRMGYVSVRG